MSETNNKINEEQIDQAVELPGAILRKTRRDKNITEQEAMVYLGLARSTLVAMEENDFSRLPADIYIRGYIRNYCKMLDISYENTMSGYAKLRSELVRTESEVEVNSTQSSSPSTLLKFFVLTVVIALVVGWLLFSFFSDSNAQTFNSERNGDLAEVLVLNTSADVVSENSLILYFQGDTWVEVTDAKKDILFTGMGFTDSKKILNGIPPYQVKISDHSVVEIIYAGAPVEVESTLSGQLASALTEIIVGRDTS